jgi:hypothetical protein
MMDRNTFVDYENLILSRKVLSVKKMTEMRNNMEELYKMERRDRLLAKAIKLLIVQIDKKIKEKQSNRASSKLNNSIHNINM